MIADDRAKRSPDSARMLPYWDKVDTIIDGIDGLRLAGREYLPPFVDEDAADYEFRLRATKCTNVYRDIIEGLASKPFEEPVSLIDGKGNVETPPESFKQFIEDVDGSGNTMTVFAGATFFNGINSAIDWIFVDYSKSDVNVVTRADQMRAGLRPYWSHVLGRNVLDAQSKVIGGKETLTFIKILEPGTPDHIREFTRDDDGVVTWELYEKRPPNTQGEEWFLVDSGDVSIGIIPLVPFVTGRRNGRSWEVFPAMKDAADLQIELYQQESALKYAKILTAYPMLAANGISAPKEADGKTPAKVRVGPNRVLFSSPDTATGRVGSWSYVEPNSESLKFLAEDINTTIQQLRELGRQPLTAQSGNITVITAAVAAGKARSAVKAWAYKLKDALENALLITAMYMNESYVPIVHVFTDFDDFLEGEDVDALLVMNERNKISDETLYEEMKRRSVLSSNFTAEREQQRLLKQLPSDNMEGEE